MLEELVLLLVKLAIVLCAIAISLTICMLLDFEPLYKIYRFKYWIIDIAKQLRHKIKNKLFPPKPLTIDDLPKEERERLRGLLDGLKNDKVIDYWENGVYHGEQPK